MVFSDFLLFLRQYKQRVFIVFGIALLMHSFFFVLFAYLRGLQIFWAGPDDVRAYTKLALHLLENHAFISYSGLMPESWYTPGYPFFLSILYLLSHNWIFAVFVQNFIASGSAILIFYLGQKYFSVRTGFLAAILFALEPTNAYISNFLWSETLFLFLFLIFVLFFLELITSENHSQYWKLAIFASIFLAAATYVRQIVFLLPLFLIALTIFVHFFILKVSRQKIFAFVGFLIVFIGLVAPWSLRNKLLFNSWSMGAAGAGTLYFYDAVPFAYFQNAKSGVAYMLGTETVQTPADSINPPKPGDPEYHYTGSGGLSKEKFMFGEAKKIISAHPLQYTAFHMTSATVGLLFIDRWRSILNRLDIAPKEVGFTKLFFSNDIKKIYESFNKRVLLWLIVGITGLLFSLVITLSMGLGIIGAWIGNGRPRKIALLAILTMLLYFIITTGPAGHRERYKYPMTPFIFIFAAEGLRMTYSTFKGPRNQIQRIVF